jgi:hypothetical protein
VELVDGRGEYSTIPFRYVWPAELDLMAQLAGLRLPERDCLQTHAAESPNSDAIPTHRSS